MSGNDYDTFKQDLCFHNGWLTAIGVKFCETVDGHWCAIYRSSGKTSMLYETQSRIVELTVEKNYDRVYDLFCELIPQTNYPEGAWYRAINMAENEWSCSVM
uniref:Uncharacterized protein n=1 Tax=Panagrolaimus sp. ES5 TaxID=591445 RepID=A0AC34GB40_9BILA